MEWWQKRRIDCVVLEKVARKVRLVDGSVRLIGKEKADNGPQENSNDDDNDNINDFRSKILVFCGERG